MRDLARRCAAEAVGTFFLVFIGVGAIAVDARTGALGHLGVSLAFGLVVATMVYATGHISGAHLNPAVTLGFRAMGRFESRNVPPYIGAQIFGAVAAATLLASTLGLPDGAGATVPTTALIPAWALELVLTFGLMFVIAAVATDERSVPGFAGLAIGFAVAMGALMGGPMTGASMNPARSFGPALATGQWSAHWLYWTAPICGAVLGGLTYQFIAHRPDAAP
jgi:MIP family channel proteins